MTATVIVVDRYFDHSGSQPGNKAFFAEPSSRDGGANTASLPGN